MASTWLVPILPTNQAQSAEGLPRLPKRPLLPLLSHLGGVRWRSASAVVCRSLSVAGKESREDMGGDRGSKCLGSPLWPRSHSGT